jgi:esterase
MTPDKGPGLNLEVLAEDLRVLVDHLGIAQFDVLGHSAGGQVALKFATLYPERIGRLALEDTAGLPYGNFNSQAVHLTFREVQFLRQMGRSFSKPSTMLQELRLLVGNDIKAAERILRLSTLPHRENFFDPVHAAAVEEFSFYSKTRDFSQAYQVYTGPIMLLVAGNRTKYLSESHLDTIRRLRKDVLIREIPESGHSIHVSQPLQWLSAIKEFFIATPLFESL